MRPSPTDQVETDATSMTRYLNEFIGTFIFVVAIFGVILSGADLAPLGIGAALTAVVYAGASTSGGHYNPAVSLAALIRGRLSAVDFGPYVAAQLVGALSAYLVALVMFGDQLDKLPTGLDLDGVLLESFVSQLVFTFALCWVVLNTMPSRRHVGNSFHGLAIGLIVTAGAFAVGTITGAAFNPAVAFALNVAGVLAWKSIWVYLLAQFLGGAAAAFAVRGLQSLDR